jgi:hypothetical protein
MKKYVQFLFDLTMCSNQATGPFPRRHRSSVNVVYKMNLPDRVNIFFLCIPILQFPQHHLPTPRQKECLSINTKNKLKKNIAGEEII